MRHRQWKFSVLTITAFWLSAGSLLAEVETAILSHPGKVSEVTLYRGQALVSRVIPVEGPAGMMELIVPDLPLHVLPESLFAEADLDSQVRAVRYRQRAVGEAPREDIRELDRQIADADRELQEIAALQQLIRQRQEYLDKLEGFVAPTATVELTQGVLNAESLERLTQFAFEQRAEAVRESLALQQRQQEANQILSLLQRQRNELADRSSRTVREAVVFLDKRNEEAVEVRLNYLVGECGWSPSYNFRAADDGKEIQLEYNALVRQRSGEDWRDVRLTLSTASPVLSAKGPGLAPFEVRLLPPGDPASRQAFGKSADPAELAEYALGIRRQRSEAQAGQAQAVDLRRNFESSFEFNRAANAWQVLELLGQRETLSFIQQETPVEADGPSLSYTLEGRISMAGRDDQQIVQIMRSEVEGRLYHVAVPVLTPYVYREAEIVNSSDEDLLAGPVNVYLEGRFVGRSEIGTVARGQTFALGFGADPQLRARRELANKSESVQGGNRELKFEYRLMLENFKSEPVQVRLVDRLPYNERENELRLTLNTEPLSDDAFYLRRERPRGILRWDVEVPAGAAGETALSIAYDYKLEFDRNLQISTPEADVSDNLQRDLQELEQFRQYRK